MKTVIPSGYRTEGDVCSVAAGKKLLIFAGKGGVGKTTLACATAVHLAGMSDNKVLLFSTDPAHSLSDCLDTPIGNQPTAVQTGLVAVELDAAEEFANLKRDYTDEIEHFIRKISPNFDLTFDRQAMEKIIDFTPAGLDEMMALTRVMGYLFQGEFDVLVLDSAPTGHLIRLLEMPEIVDQWIKTFFGLFLKYRKIFQLPQITQKLVGMSKELKFLRQLLKDPAQSALFAVTIPTEMAYAETLDLLAACKRMELAVPHLLINLVTPRSECGLCSALWSRETAVRDRIRAELPDIRQTAVFRGSEPRGLDNLASLGSALYGAVD